MRPIKTETYKLVYPDKETAITDLKSKDILDEYGNRNSFPTHNVVFVGKIVDVKGTYGEQGEVLTPPTFKEGYHVDVMDERLDLDFGEYRKFPTKEYHTF